MAGTVAQDRPAPEALLLLVDYSGSMSEPDGSGSTRIASAETALRDIIGSLPEDLQVGMRVYGHRVPSADKAAACQDTELVVPVQPLDRGRLLGEVDRLEPLGETPIGLSLQQAAADLPDDVPGTVILVSDGADECFGDDLGPDPCQVTRDLVAQGLDIRLETIGLQVEPEGREQLQCMADAGGGEFTSVEDAGLLAEAIAAARNRAARAFQVRGEVVQGGPALIDATVLGPGTYTDAIVEGETLWFAADLAREEEVSVRLTIRTSGVPADAGIALEWTDEAARRIDAAVLDGVPPGQATTLALSTGAVDGSRSPFGAVLDPGRYYLGVRVAGFPRDVPHEFVLELLARGEPGGPATSSAAPSPVESDPTPAVTANQTVVALPDAPAGGVPTAFVLLLIALVGGAGAYLWWRGRRGRQDDRDDSGYV